MLAQLDEAIHKARRVSLAVYESTDVSDNSQLLFMQLYSTKTKKELCEDILGLTSLQTNTRGEDIYLAIKEM